jgi:hypothetical protein
MQPHNRFIMSNFTSDQGPISSIFGAPIRFAFCSYQFSIPILHDRERLSIATKLRKLI